MVVVIAGLCTIATLAAVAPSADVRVYERPDVSWRAVLSDCSRTIRSNKTR